jgi:hypothetical protein
MTLTNLQGAFSDFLRDRPNALRDRVRGGPHADIDTLLGIYRSAYTIRLVKILQDDFDRLRKFAGDALFDRIAKEYLAAHPSIFFSVRWIGGGLADFLAGTGPWRNDPELVQLARLEWAQTMAFDAADAPLATREELVSVPPVNWPDLTLSPHASVQLLAISPDIFALWQALGRDEPAGEKPARFAPDVPHLVWRTGLDVKLRELEPDEADAWAAAIEGEPFAAICERLCDHVPVDRAALRAAELLDRWITTGMVGRIDFTPTMSS